MNKISRSSLVLNSVVWMLGLLLSSAIPAHAQLAQLWPTFSEPSSIVTLNLAGSSADDDLAESTLIGAYNQLQGTSRIYITGGANAWWLTQSVPSSISVSSLSWNTSDPDGALKALLTNYGSSIQGYIVCDPVNMPESCNMATTMAGIKQAMVVNPDNLAVMSAYTLPEIADLRTYTWIGNNASLVGNTTINQVNNPSGGSGTTGWGMSSSGSGQTLGTGTYGGESALKWTVAASQGSDRWAQFNPTATKGSTYVFSVQVAGSGTVYLDAFDGIEDVTGSTVTLSSTYQTLQLSVPIPLSDSSNVVQLQVRAHSQSSAVTCYFLNAAVISNQVAIDTYQYNNLISEASALALVQETPGKNDIRDYAVAGKLFTFQLTSDNADEKTLYGDIISHTAHNTPILGYIEDEANDVPFLSGSGEGHFLNASDDYSDGSVWASLPQPSSLSQPAPSGIKTANGTVYVAFGMSDGDNVSYLQNRMQTDWTTNQYLGAVPAAWTMPPGAINYSPAMMSHYYKFLPQSSEMMAGPGGIGYATAMTSSDLGTFGSLTHEFMTAESMSTVTSWQTSSSAVPTFATDVNVPHIVYKAPYSYALDGSTVIDGQDEGYINTAPEEVAAIESYVSSNISSSAPLFVEVLGNGWGLSPDDLLYITQQLQLTGGHPYVFLTPSALALTEKAYYQGTGSSLPTSNAQAVPGATLVSAYPNNLVTNALGASGAASLLSSGWGLGTTGHKESLLTTVYEGSGIDELRVPASASSNVWTWSEVSVPAVNQYYTFSANVAGSGQVRLCVYDGTANNLSPVITLTPTMQTITLFVEIKSATAGQLQIVVPVQSTAATVYFSAGGSYIPSWYYVRPGTASTNVTLGTTSYNNMPAMVMKVPANEGNDQLVWTAPPTVAASTSYKFSVDVAGSGQVYLSAWNGSTDDDTSVVTLGSNYQTLSETITTAATFNPAPQLQVRAQTQSTPVTVYFRNVSVTPISGTTDFSTGLESGQTQLSWSNTVDATSPGGGESGVSSAILSSTPALTRGGSYAIQYGGTASGGTSTHAYMEAFSESTTLSTTSRLSYWIYPQSNLGSEPGASSMTGLDSTCVAIDVIFTDGTALRNLGITDQYGNLLNPADECNHLQPDQWNYVTANLSSISGKTISRIDIGYDQPGANGNYGGYIDDISLTH